MPGEWPPAMVAAAAHLLQVAAGRARKRERGCRARRESEMGEKRERAVLKFSFLENYGFVTDFLEP